jgi:hypothetical protein
MRRWWNEKGYAIDGREFTQDDEWLESPAVWFGFGGWNGGVDGIGKSGAGGSFADGGID